MYSKEYKQKDVDKFEIDGYRCIIMQQTTGHLCGYVDLPDEHPVNDFEDYEDFWDADIEVHGGITYSEDYLMDSENNKRPGNWIGFDCAHAGDLIPAYDDMPAGINDTFRDEDYVRNELKNLVEQLKDFEG